MKLLVLLNEGAKGLAGSTHKEAVDRVARCFAEAGADADVQCVDVPTLLQNVKLGAASDFDAMVIGGGDGLVAAAVNAVASVGHKPLGVLPLGMNNHFAREMGVPLELASAARSLARGKVAELAVAEVNGRIFLTCVAYGLAPQHGSMVRRLTGLDHSRVRVRSRGHTFAAGVATVVVCNSAHPMKTLGVAAARTPEPGLLNVYVPTSPASGGRLGNFIARLTTGSPRNLAAMALSEVRIESAAAEVEVSIDGDIWALRPPLTCRIRPRTMRVLVPADHPLPAISNGIHVRNGLDELELEPQPPSTSPSPSPSSSPSESTQPQ